MNYKFLLVIVVFFACGRDQYLSTQELEFLPIKTKDTVLFFNETSLEIDSLVYLGVSKDTMQFDPWTVIPRFRERANLICTSKKKTPESFVILSISALPDSNTVSFALHTKYVSEYIFNTLDIQKLIKNEKEYSIDGVRIKGIKVFPSNRIQPPSQIEYLIWNQDLGLIQYKIRDKSTWTRTDL